MLLGWKIKQFLKDCDDLRYVTDYSACLISAKKLLKQAIPLITEMEKVSHCKTNVCCETSDDEEEIFDEKTELESDDYESDYDDFLTDDDLDFSDNSF